MRHHLYSTCYITYLVLSFPITQHLPPFPPSFPSCLLYFLSVPFSPPALLQFSFKLSLCLTDYISFSRSPVPSILLGSSLSFFSAFWNYATISSAITRTAITSQFLVVDCQKVNTAGRHGDSDAPATCCSTVLKIATRGGNKTCREEDAFAKYLHPANNEEAMSSSRFIPHYLREVYTSVCTESSQVNFTLIRSSQLYL